MKEAASVLRAGFHKQAISPPVGVPLAGFAARTGVCAGVHDELYARALVLDNGRQAVAFVSLDVLAMPAALVVEVRGRIGGRTGLPADAIMVSATHTHAGPITMRAFCQPEESIDPAYHARLTAAVEEAVAVAWAQRAPARAGAGTGRVTGIGVNRRSADGRPVDEEVGILAVEDEAGRVRGALVNFACHPTVLGPDNLLVTGDYPAYMVERIEATLGAGSFALFVNGAEGDVSMGHSSELSAIGIVTPGRTFERAAELGYRLADAVLEALPQIVRQRDVELRACSIVARLPAKRYPDAGETRRRFDAACDEVERLTRDGASFTDVAAARTRRLYASIEHYFAEEASALDGELPIEVHAIRVGDALFVGAPAEIFVEIGLRLKQHAGHRLFLMGLTNGYIAYMPTRAAYAADGYEVVSSPLAEGADEQFEEHVRALEAQMFA